MFKPVAKYMASVLALMFLLAAPAFAADINWQSSYQEALAVSKTENKPIMVIFTADWCVFCKKLENQTLTDPKVIRLINNNFVAVKIDKDKNPQIAKDFQVQGIPDIYFLAPYDSGKTNIDVIARQLGFIKPENFIPGLESMISQF